MLCQQVVQVIPSQNIFCTLYKRSEHLLDFILIDWCQAHRCGYIISTWRQSFHLLYLSCQLPFEGRIILIAFTLDYSVLPFYTRTPQIHSTITSLSEALYMASKMLLQEISREAFEFGSGENQEVVVIHQPIICLASLGRQGHLPNSPRKRLTFQYALCHTDY